MKKTILLLTLVPSIAFGNLIDLTPGGFYADNAPPVFYDFLVKAERPNHWYFFDSIYASPTNGFPAGWVSRFGELNGGVYFFSNIDQSGPVPTTTISWNFGGNGSLCFVLIDAGVANGNLGALSNLYRVPLKERFEGEGTVTLDGFYDINSIAFYGRLPSQGVPDSGTTIGLFLIGLLGIFGCGMVCRDGLQRDIPIGSHRNTHPNTL
jgi:hypothetical protein